jgi:hypothetical protein
MRARGIEPRSAAWKAAIITTRPYAPNILWYYHCRLYSPNVWHRRTKVRCETLGESQNRLSSFPNLKLTIIKEPLRASSHGLTVTYDAVRVYVCEVEWCSLPHVWQR